MVKVFRKYSVLVMFGLLYLFSSCSKEIDLYTDYTPVPLVYCQVDPTDSFCFVTLSKSFQSFTDARDVLINADELKMNDARIVLEVWGSKYKAWETGFSLINPTIIGSASRVVSRSVYRSDKILHFHDPSLDSLPRLGTYDHFRLIITSPEFKQIIYSKVQNIKAPIIRHPRTPIQFNLYGGKYSYFLFFIDKDEVKHVDFTCDFYYKEFTDKWIDRKAKLMLKTNMIVQDSIYIRMFEESFFNKLTNAIKEDPNVSSRLFVHMDFTLLVSDVYFHDYYMTYKGSKDNDYVFYSNIVNGMGLFSAKRKTTISNIKGFDRMTFDSLCHGRFTKHLNFRDW